ncbi:LysR family transcriptional regulator [Nocardia paucivorans]|uniref:LysR family transcriptional regulator n=1 Tax=Nocardia paucivorans TaxID=114259 RepID=UPI0002F3C3A4|nr:LysR family transcriptional regulator [Nocardia paucivorans]
MDPRYLELLRELDERGSVTAVARATHRTPSAVSQQLRNAERAFGASLVEPAGRGLRLTDAGRVLAAAGRDLAEVMARAQARWDDFRGEPAGTVAVAALPSAATFLLPGVFRDLAALPIDIVCADFDLAEAEFPRLVTDHDIVIGHSLSRTVPDAAGLITVELVREPLDIAMAEHHPLAAQSTVTAADLADQPWIGVPLGYPFDAVRLAVEEAAGRRLDIRQRIRDNRLVEALIADSDQVAVLPRFTTPHGSGVVLRPLADSAIGRHVFAILRPDRAERRAVQRVLDAFVRVGATFVGE